MRKRVVIDGSVQVDGTSVKIDNYTGEFYNMERCTSTMLKDGVLCRNNDGMRSMMKTSFMKSVVPLVNPDTQYIIPSYNLDFNKNNIYKLSKDKHRMVDIIYRGFNEHDKRCTIFYVDDNNVLHMKEIKSIHTMSDGVAIQNQVDTPNHIYKTTSFSEEGFLNLGQNALCMWAVTLGVLEDAQKITTEFSERNKTLSYNTVSIKVNPDNIIFTSGFPNIGSKRDTSVALSFNQDNNYTNILSPKINYDKDKGIYYNPSPGYICEDIDIYYRNTSIFTDEYISELVNIDREYKYNIYNKIQELKRLYPSNPKVDMESSIVIEQFLDMFDRVYIKNAKIRNGTKELEDNKVFMTFTFTKLGTYPGQKYSGLHGNKGTVSVIQDFIAKDEFGRNIDMALAGAGIIPRTNFGQAFEMGLNFLSFRLMEEMRLLNLPISKRKKHVLEFLSYICTANVERYQCMFDNESDKDLEESLFSLDHIPIYLHPYNYDISMSNFGELVNSVMRVNPAKFANIQDLYIDLFNENGEKIGRGVIGHMYICRAKQTASKKQSVRPKGRTGSNGIPKKTAVESRFKDTPIKRSEPDNHQLASTLKYASDLSILLDNKKSMEAARALFRALGLEVVI